MPYSSSLPTGMAHVERSELYENLQARLQYLQSFLEFGPADVQVLKECRPQIKAMIPTLSDNHFFTKILKQDITAQALVTKNTKEEAYLDEDDFYGPDSKNIRNRNMFVRWYLTKMNSDPTTSSYWEYMNMVGAMHAGHHRRNPLEIDVIHFSLLIGYVQNTLTEAIILSPTIPAQYKAPLVKAWGKLLWIQMDLFTKWHVKDGKEYDQLTTRATKLDASTDFGGMKDDEGQPVRCPFSSVARLEPVEVKGQLKPGTTTQSIHSSTSKTSSSHDNPHRNFHQEQHHIEKITCPTQQFTMEEPPRNYEDVLLRIPLPYPKSNEDALQRIITTATVTTTATTPETRMQPPVPDLTLHMLPHRHEHLSTTLYASPHGGPIRTLPLIMSSGTIKFEIHIPCFALYDRASNPTITTEDLTQEQWNTLYGFVQEEGVLKVILSPDGGKTDFLARLTTVEGGMGNERLEEGSVGVRVWWQEQRGGPLVARIRRGLEWVKEKVEGLG
ncbi:hypothetical protein N0V90_012073 [Kalmusia sp. IMI 367209]|nr:hypothetical protein N0V90_012073 [Kalmusia sp. IMI 367209]